MFLRGFQEDLLQRSTQLILFPILSLCILGSLSKNCSSTETLDLQLWRCHLVLANLSPESCGNPPSRKWIQGSSSYWYLTRLFTMKSWFRTATQFAYKKSLSWWLAGFIPFFFIFCGLLGSQDSLDSKKRRRKHIVKSNTELYDSSVGHLPETHSFLHYPLSKQDNKRQSAFCQNLQLVR